MFGLVYSPWEQGYNKSPRVPGLSFPVLSLVSIFAVPNNAVFTITSQVQVIIIIIILKENVLLTYDQCTFH